MTISVRAFLTVAALCGALIGLASPAIADHPNALWRVVHRLCLTDMRLTGRPAPCLAYSRREGFAVVPDPKGPTQILLVPTRRLSGIESPEILAEGAPNYWRAAWDARRYVERRAKRAIPRDRLGLVINSAYSRSQDQLHIHVDCVRADVRELLRTHGGEFGIVWTPLDEPINGMKFKVRWLAGEDLADRDPFKLLARGDAEARAHMDKQTLAVIGGTSPEGAPGYYLMASADSGGFGEILLDHQCRVLKQL